MSVPIYLSNYQSPTQSISPTTFTYRRINAIDYPKFIDDLNSSHLITNPPAACPTCSTHFSQPFAHYSIITPLFSLKPINPLALPPLLGSPLKSSVLSLPTAVWNAPTSPHTLFLTSKLASYSYQPLPYIYSRRQKSFYASLV